MEHWNGTLQQAHNVARKVWDRIYRINMDVPGWWRVMDSPDHTIGFVSPTGDAFSYGTNGYYVAANYRDEEDTE